jgi:hypothetical protein
MDPLLNGGSAPREEFVGMVDSRTPDSWECVLRFSGSTNIQVVEGG